MHCWLLKFTCFLSSIWKVKIITQSFTDYYCPLEYLNEDILHILISEVRNIMHCCSKVLLDLGLSKDKQGYCNWS